jgi:hypothetical protein
MENVELIKPATRGASLTLKILCVISVITISGWHYGFIIFAPLLLWYGVRFKKWVYYELLSCKFKGIRSYRVADVYHHKKGVLMWSVCSVLLAMTGVMLHYFHIIDFPDWINCMGIIILAWFFIFYGSQFLAFSKYQKYLITFLSKEDYPEEWNADDIAFEKRLRKQQEKDDMGPFDALFYMDEDGEIRVKK